MSQITAQEPFGDSGSVNYFCYLAVKSLRVNSGKMRNPLVVLAALLTVVNLCSSASAQSELDAMPVLPPSGWAGSALDLKSGNSYDWAREPNGTTYLRGSDSNDGTDSTTVIQPNGDMRGIDANGDYWTFSKGADTYRNFETGQICIGQRLGWVCE